MRYARFVLPCAALLPMLVMSAFGDFLILKAGERVEGKITDDNEKSVTIQFQASPGITDERIIQKTDVAKLSKASPDEEAYVAIMNVQTGQNSLSLAQYAQVIARLKAYVTQYNTSRHAIDIQQAVNGFEAEKKRVQGGEVKINGAWLDKEQTRIQRVQVGGVFAFEAMKSEAASGDFIAALNSFGQIEKLFPGARVYPDAVDLAKQVLANFKPLVENAIANEKISKANLENGWSKAGPKDKAEMMEAYKRDQAREEAASALAVSAGQWPPFAKDNPKCLKTLETKIDSEQKRLSVLPVASFRDSVERSDNAERLVASGQPADALAALKDALVSWPANEAAIRLQKDIGQIKAPPPPVPVSTPAAKATPASKPAR